MVVLSREIIRPNPPALFASFSILQLFPMLDLFCQFWEWLFFVSERLHNYHLSGESCVILLREARIIYNNRLKQYPYQRTHLHNYVRLHKVSFFPGLPTSAIISTIPSSEHDFLFSVSQYIQGIQSKVRDVHCVNYKSDEKLIEYSMC